MGVYKATDTTGQALNTIYAEDSGQFADLLSGKVDGGALTLMEPVAAPASAPTVTLQAGSLNGTYKWAWYLITGIQDGTGAVHITGRTPLSPATASQSLTSQEGSISLPNGYTFPTGVYGWGLARTLNGGSTYYVVTEQFMNKSGAVATSYVDNTADANLTVAAPTTNTTGTSLSGTIDATTLKGLPQSDYLRTDSGAPSPQNVAKSVTFQDGFTVNGGAGSEGHGGGFVQWVSGYPSPISARAIIGDGTGWKAFFSTFDGTTITDPFTFHDNGNFDVAGIITAPNLKENYIPLWYDTGGTANTSASASGTSWLQLGGGSTTTVGPSVKLHPLDSNWPTSTQFAFEAAMFAANSGATAYAALWDFTSSSLVTGSQISTTAYTSGNMTPVRSGTFTLSPGHVYGVTVWSSSGLVYYTNVALVVNP